MIKLKNWKKFSKSNHKISMLTCYDYWSAKLLEETQLDAILVGDSVSNIMHGEEHTTACTTEIIELHVKSVSRGIKTKPIIADIPFLEAESSQDIFLKSAKKLIQAGAHAIKVEGASDQALVNVKKIVDAGVPVMGHIGLTPQSVLKFGGYRVQGKSETHANHIIQEAKRLQDAGVFSIVVECVPNSLATELTKVLSVPTIGIGAGIDTDGQILVLHDLTGLQKEFKPKFVRQFAQLGLDLITCVDNYVDNVNNLKFPSINESYEIRGDS